MYSRPIRQSALFSLTFMSNTTIQAVFSHLRIIYRTRQKWTLTSKDVENSNTSWDTTHQYSGCLMCGSGRPNRYTKRYRRNCNTCGMYSAVVSWTFSCECMKANARWKSNFMREVLWVFNYWGLIIHSWGGVRTCFHVTVGDPEMLERSPGKKAIKKRLSRLKGYDLGFGDRISPEVLVQIWMFNRRIQVRPWLNMVQ